jgi:hypothetical protein
VGKAAGGGGVQLTAQFYLVLRLRISGAIFFSPFKPPWPMPVVARSKAWVCGHYLAGIAASNPVGGHGRLSLVSVVLSGRGLCDGLISNSEESHRLCCVWV